MVARWVLIPGDRSQGEEGEIADSRKYEEKFAFGCGPVIATLFTIGCIAALVFLQDKPMKGSDEMPLLVKIALYGGAALGSFGIVRLLVVIAKGRVALRVDERGIWMSRLAFRDKVARRKARLTPWGDFDLIVLQHEETAPAGADTFLYLRRCEDSRELQVASVPQAGWSLNQEKFLAVVRHYAPAVDFDERYVKPKAQ